MSVTTTVEWINQLKSIELNNRGFHPPTSRRIYIKLLRFMREYQINLLLWANTQVTAYQ